MGEGGHGLGVVRGRSVGLELSAHQDSRKVEGHSVANTLTRLSDTSTRSPIDGTLRELHQVTRH